jgi:hypothetical protein
MTLVDADGPLVAYCRRRRFATACSHEKHSFSAGSRDPPTISRIGTQGNAQVEVSITMQLQ